MINATMICWILILHFIGDWVLQTREMARNKCLIGIDMAKHIFIYWAVLTWGMMLAFYPEFLSKQYTEYCTMAFAWPFINAFIHFSIDAITSNITKDHWHDGKPNKTFWNTIGLDQLSHGIILFSTYKWLSE